MPVHSEKQRRLLYAKAREGVPWARRYLKHSGEPLPSTAKGRRKHYSKGRLK